MQDTMLPRSNLHFSSNPKSQNIVTIRLNNLMNHLHNYLLSMDHILH